jgi:hypothetical protein
MLEALALIVAIEEPAGNIVRDLRLLSFERIEPKHCNFFSRLSEGIVEQMRRRSCRLVSLPRFSTLSAGLLLRLKHPNDCRDVNWPKPFGRFVSPGRLRYRRPGK